MPIDQEHVERAAQFIKDRLRDMNGSYEELGARVGLTQSDVSRTVNGRTLEPSFRVICRIARLLNVPLSDMAELFGEHTPKGWSEDARLRRLSYAISSLSPEDRQFALDMVEALAIGLENKIKK